MKSFYQYVNWHVYKLGRLEIFEAGMENSTKRVNTSQESINILYILALNSVTKAKGSDMV